MSSGRLQKKGPVAYGALDGAGAGGLGLFPVQNTNSKTRLRLQATGNSGIAPRMARSPPRELATLSDCRSAWNFVRA